MFSMTSAAAHRIREAAHESGVAESALRVAARREPDGSIQYGMGFDDAQEGEDPVLQMDGVTVLIAPSSRALLQGTVLDFVELEPGDFSFIFVPPPMADGTGCASGAATSATRGCGSGGCGSGGCGSVRRT